MALNVELLREELRNITIHPELHAQGLWVGAETEVELPPGVDRYSDEWYDFKTPPPPACGSYGCLAGNTVVHGGHELDWFIDYHETLPGKKVAIWKAESILDEYITHYEGTEDEFTEKKSIHTKAKEMFDLTERQANKLFDGDNSLDDLWRYAEEISAGQIQGNKDNFYSDYAIALREYEQVQAEAKKKEEAAK